MSELSTKVRHALRAVGDLEIVRLDNPEFEVDTSVGVMRVAPRNGAIMCRFMEPQRARRKVLCNVFTGKWNHFQMPHEPLTEFIAGFEQSLECLKGGAA